MSRRGAGAPEITSQDRPEVGSVDDNPTREIDREQGRAADAAVEDGAARESTDSDFEDEIAEVPRKRRARNRVMTFELDSENNSGGSARG